MWKKERRQTEKTSLHTLILCYFWNLHCMSQSRVESLAS